MWGLSSSKKQILDVGDYKATEEYQEFLDYLDETLGECRFCGANIEVTELPEGGRLVRRDCRCKQNRPKGDSL